MFVETIDSGFSSVVGSPAQLHHRPGSDDGAVSDVDNSAPSTMSDAAIRVSIAELLEVRADGLYAPELLAIIVGACNHLQFIDKTGIFNADYVFFSPNGGIEISLVSPTHLPEENTPPELRDDDYEDAGHSFREPQLVWCLGNVIQHAIARSCTDAELISLVNLMMVTHVGTRPTLAKLGQMAKKRCATGGIDPQGVLKAMYEELMGDIDELIDDDGVASSIGGWSSHNGRAEAPPVGAVVTQAARHRDTSLPSTSSGSGDDEVSLSEGGQSEVHTEAEDDHHKVSIGHGAGGRFLDPVEEENSHRQARRVSVDSSIADSTISDGGTLATASRRDSDSSNRTMSDGGEHADGERTPPGTGRDPSPEPVTVIPTVAKLPAVETRMYRRSSSSSSSTSDTEHSPGRSLSTASKPEPLRKDTPDTSNLFPLVSQRSPSSTTAPPAVQTIAEREDERSSDDAEVPVPMMRPPSPKPIPKTSAHGIVSARKKSSLSSADVSTPQPPTRSTSTSVVPPSPVATRTPVPSTNGRLSRNNSLEPGRVRRSNRKISGYQPAPTGPRKTFAVPEFIEKQATAVIRLQAQTLRKKKLTLHRTETTFVLVKVVSGQTVEVSVRSDALVGCVFDTVVDHFNVTEHNFFGLAVIRDNEFFFLDAEQRLEKYAPAGWKSAKKATNENYMLYLRFRYYPKRLEFVKTPATTHSLYLQLRQDILNDNLKPSRDKTFELGALALQTEFGDHPSTKVPGKSLVYFQLKNYLPSRSYLDQDSSRIESVLAEIHSHYEGLASVQSERQFIELCQQESEYGAHYHRVYKFKPGHNAADKFADVQYIAILPDGIGLCSQQGSYQTSFVVINSFHPWHAIRTLQFDKKRFLIATADSGIVVDHVFYTDHYSKSSYLVRFAATQHRFMIKMRHWQYTLSRERPSATTDVGIDRSTEPVGPIKKEEPASSSVFELMPTRKQTIPEDSVVEAPPVVKTASPPRTRKASGTNPFDSGAESSGDGFDQGRDSPQRVNLTITLEKDPATGLGLTLVDGVVDDIKGVYVKSVSDEGDARRKGVEKGDCLQAINGISLVDKTRHDAVELVKASPHEVVLEILRFPYITQLIGHERAHSKDEAISLSQPATRKALPTKTELLTGKKASVSRTPPAPRKTTPSSVPPARQRAVSDFGAIGDALPVLNSEDLLAGFTTRRPTSPDSDTEDEADANNGEARRGEYRLPVTSIYNFDASDDDDETDAKLHKKQSVDADAYPRDDATSWVSKATLESSAQRSVNTYSQRHNLDWTHELSDIENLRGDDPDALQRLQINIYRLGSKSLGFQVASNNGIFYVKAVNSEPAISAELKVDDRIVAINGRNTHGLSHQDVVDILKTDRSPTIVLTVDRAQIPSIDESRTITVSLEKTPNTPLGLSLAKRTGRDGIYIRSIAVGTLAERDGRLHVGDRIWAIEEVDVSEMSASQIVERLAAAEGPYVDIVVKRTAD
uniref:FERM domain-containing protein n=1 Tax=Panagrellus redivivus TaxID=6233 RepID=A0A7E4W8Z8_PANRE